MWKLRKEGGGWKAERFTSRSKAKEKNVEPILQQSSHTKILLDTQSNLKPLLSKLDILMD